VMLGNQLQLNVMGNKTRYVNLTLASKVVDSATQYGESDRSVISFTSQMAR
jgi:hypothetical protein